MGFLNFTLLTTPALLVGTVLFPIRFKIEKYHAFAEAAVMIIGLLESVGPSVESY